MKIDHKEYDREIRFRDDELCKALEHYGGRYSYEKKIAHPLFELSKHELRALFDAMVKGDGHINPQTGKPMYYSTVSERLARDFIWLANFIGYATNVKKRAAESIKNVGRAKGNPNQWKDLFIINLSKRRSVTSWIKVEKKNYDGRVYDLVVEGNHNFFASVKNSGKFVLMGDSLLSRDKQMRLPIKRKRRPPMICPKCGKRGFLQRTSNRGRIYWRVSHKEDSGKRRHCWLGPRLETNIFQDMIKSDILEATA